MAGRRATIVDLESGMHHLRKSLSCLLRSEEWPANETPSVLPRSSRGGDHPQSPTISRPATVVSFVEGEEFKDYEVSVSEKPGKKSGGALDVPQNGSFNQFL